MLDIGYSMPDEQNAEGKRLKKVFGIQFSVFSWRKSVACNGVRGQGQTVSEMHNFTGE